MGLIWRNDNYAVRSATLPIAALLCCAVV
ncbi:hypothetical protein PMI03_03671, partial [Rhizobium sp. AP16]